MHLRSWGKCIYVPSSLHVEFPTGQSFANVVSPLGTLCQWCLSLQCCGNARPGGLLFMCLSPSAGSTCPHHHLCRMLTPQTWQVWKARRALVTDLESGASGPLCKGGRGTMVVSDSHSVTCHLQGGQQGERGRAQGLESDLSEQMP